ncbi:Protein ELYS [Cricetulus griseus]|uniref:Protein ELYS n=1 Tax=Cricetulus griseus TaxID=10029 RepID=G3H7N7_CRIGR|nr:Protein ELYS [Cricetulus griseus]
MQDLTAQVTSELLHFPEVTIEALGEDEITLESVLRGKFAAGKNGLACLACGPQLEVVNSLSGERLSAYRFSGVNEQPPVVLAVKEFSWHKRTGLLVGLEEADGSVLCLYDLGISRVVKAVVLPGRVTAIEPIINHGGASASTQHLHPSLRWLFGVAAVVTDVGQILLIDLCLDDLSCSQNEVEASALSPDTSVSVFTWQVNIYGQGKPSVYLGLFDINRWYHAQMPDSLRVRYNYPVIQNFYTSRRQKCERSPRGKWNHDCLMIDGLVSQLGDQVEKLWKRDEGGTGKYPPASIHNGLDLLFHPVTAKPTSWQHSKIIEAFMGQGEHKQALRYLQTMKPTVSSSSDVILHLTVLLFNRCMVEAWNLLRHNSNRMNIEELLKHAYEVCQEMGLMEDLLKLPFTDTEQATDDRNAEVFVSTSFHKCGLPEETEWMKTSDKNVYFPLDIPAKGHQKVVAGSLDTHSRSLEKLDVSKEDSIASTRSDQTSLEYHDAPSPEDLEDGIFVSPKPASASTELTANLALPTEKENDKDLFKSEGTPSAVEKQIAVANMVEDVESSGPTSSKCPVTSDHSLDQKLTLNLQENNEIEADVHVGLPEEKPQISVSPPDTQEIHLIEHEKLEVQNSEKEAKPLSFNELYPSGTLKLQYNFDTIEQQFCDSPDDKDSAECDIAEVDGELFVAQSNFTLILEGEEGEVEASDSTATNMSSKATNLATKEKPVSQVEPDNQEHVTDLPSDVTVNPKVETLPYVPEPIKVAISENLLDVIKDTRSKEATSATVVQVVNEDVALISPKVTRSSKLTKSTLKTVQETSAETVNTNHGDDMVSARTRTRRQHAQNLNVTPEQQESSAIATPKKKTRKVKEFPGSSDSTHFKISIASETQLTPQNSLTPRRGRKKREVSQDTLTSPGTVKQEPQNPPERLRPQLLEPATEEMPSRTEDKLSSVRKGTPRRYKKSVENEQSPNIVRDLNISTAASHSGTNKKRRNTNSEDSQNVEYKQEEPSDQQRPLKRRRVREREVSVSSVIEEPTLDSAQLPTQTELNVPATPRKCGRPRKVVSLEDGGSRAVEGQKSPQKREVLSVRRSTRNTPARNESDPKPLEIIEEQKTRSRTVKTKASSTTIRDPKNRGHLKTFTFDLAYWSHDGFQKDEDGVLIPSNPTSKFAGQIHVFHDIGRGILDSAWRGYNATLLAYGQTGSGKSYSMIGFGTNKGIIPRVCEELFQAMKTQKKNIEPQIRDLLSRTKTPGGLKVREDQQLGFFVEGLKWVPCENYTQIEKLMEQGSKIRMTASTNMNASSSRSHMVITIQLKQVFLDMALTKQSSINMVDLAGSERQKSSGSEGDRLREGSRVNLSLTSLGNVISALADSALGKKVLHIPYRDSVLTKLLQSSLGGNSRTTLYSDTAACHSTLSRLCCGSSRLRVGLDFSRVWNVPFLLPIRAILLTVDLWAGCTKRHCVSYTLFPTLCLERGSMESLNFSCEMKGAKKVQNRATINTCTLVRAARAENKLLLGFGGTGEAEHSACFLAEWQLGTRGTWAHLLAEAQKEWEEQYAALSKEQQMVKVVPYLLNVNEDPQLTGVLKYFIHNGTGSCCFPYRPPGQLQFPFNL